MIDKKNNAEPSSAAGDSGERGPDLRGPAVIVNGSVIAGFTFTGPFATIEEAAEWHRTKSLAGHLGLPAAAIVLLEKPRQEVFDEPVAWMGRAARTDGGDFTVLRLDRKHAESDVREEAETCEPREIVPLYRHPQPTLTAAEREAIEWFAEVRKPLSSFDDGEYVFTLRKLFERLGGER